MLGLIRVKTVYKSYQQTTRELKFERYNIGSVLFFRWERVGGES